MHAPRMPHICMPSSPFFCQLCVALTFWRRLLRQQLRAWHCKRSPLLCEHSRPTHFLSFFISGWTLPTAGVGWYLFHQKPWRWELWSDMTKAANLWWCDTCHHLPLALSPHPSSHYMAERGHWTETKKTPESWVLGNDSPAYWHVILVTCVMIPSIALCLSKGYRWGQSEEIHP